METHGEEFEITKIIPPYDFEPAVTTYNIYPWFAEGETLGRVLRLISGKVVVSTIRSEGTVSVPKLRVSVDGDTAVRPNEVQEIRDVLIWSLLLDVDVGRFQKVLKADPILTAAAGRYQGGRGKVYPSAFEALIGVICAQNTVFKRLYSMMHNLSVRFGQRLTLSGADYYGFPTARDLAAVSEDDLRACKVGYRARVIARLARELVSRQIDLEALKAATTAEAKEFLLTLPGVGPYTANLVLSVGLRRTDVVHLDSYVRATMSKFYFDGRSPSDDEIEAYARSHWAGFESLAIGLLTTDTHVWSEKLGVKFELRSGARTDR